MAAQTSGAKSGSCWRASSPVSQYICKPKGCQTFMRLSRLEICFVLRAIRNASVAFETECQMIWKPRETETAERTPQRKADLVESRSMASLFPKEPVLP